MSYELIVVDAFEFADGRTVFSCEAVSAPKYIRACRCVLQLDGRPVAELRLEGENLPDPNRSGLRVVSTGTSVDINVAQVAARAYRLICEN